MHTAPKSDEMPALLGAPPLFPEGLPLARPTVRDPEAVAARMAETLASGALTDGPLVRRFEEQAASYLGVRHCVAVGSCTAGLMLVLRAAELTGDVLVPSFTFAATAHAVAWNGLRPVFVDIRSDTLNMSSEACERAIGAGTSAILAAHIFGTPADVEGLERIAEEHGLRLLFDAAHAFGSRHLGQMVGGFGDAEVFSLSPTKVLVAGEGGVIATDDDLLAERCRIGRNYGNPGDYDCRFVGLNARMSEFHAAVALGSFEDLEDRLTEREELAAAYRDALGGLPGITFPSVSEGDRSTFKDLTILVDPEGFGLGPDDLGRALAAEGIETRRYYAPPVHTMQAYRSLGAPEHTLEVTDQVASRTLTLPLWTGMGAERVRRVALAISRSRAVAGKLDDPGG
jgi:dTDP-4-amino-4,6-dideoxygalactose transaminase